MAVGDAALAAAGPSAWTEAAPKHSVRDVGKQTKERMSTMSVKKETLSRAMKIVAEFDPSGIVCMAATCGCSGCGFGCSGTVGMD